MSEQADDLLTGADESISNLLDAWAAGTRTIDGAEIRRVRQRVVRDALEAPSQIPAPPEFVGFPLDGRPLRTGDLVDVRLAKYIQHAVREEHWPLGTTLEEFLQSLEATVRSEQGGIYADRRSSGWRLTFVSRSGHWEGLDGGPVIILLSIVWSVDSSRPSSPCVGCGTLTTTIRWTTVHG